MNRYSGSYSVISNIIDDKGNALKVKFTDPKDLKPYEVDISRLIRVFVNNITDHRRSVK